MSIAVTGALGNVGARVVRELAAARHEVVAVARRPAPDLKAPYVCSALADYDDMAGLRAAFRGVGTLVLISSDGPVAKVMVHHRNLVTAAADSGVTHIVALSGLDADLRSPFCYAVSNGFTEQLLRDSGSPRWRWHRPRVVRSTSPAQRPWMRTQSPHRSCARGYAG